MTELNLIKSECANYFPDSGGEGRIKNYCCLHNKTCVLSGETDSNGKTRCNYFEENVLPLNPELEFQYRQQRGISILDLQVTCKDCLEPFIRSSRNEKYCPRCKSNRKKQQKNRICRKSERQFS